jgi:hypothetical protein
MVNQDWNTQTKKNTINLAFWTIAWTLSLALATFGPKFIWEGANALTVIGIILNALLGVGMILANIRHINGLDDLQRKIQLEGMAIALGVGIIGGLSYSLLDTTNVIKQDAEISYLVILISLTYMISILIGQKRYK